MSFRSAAVMRSSSGTIFITRSRPVRSNSAASALVNAYRWARSAGRVSGVRVPVCHKPCRSGRGAATGIESANITTHEGTSRLIVNPPDPDGFSRWADYSALLTGRCQEAVATVVWFAFQRKETADDAPGDVVRSARQRRRKAPAVLRRSVRVDVRRDPADQLRGGEDGRLARHSWRDRTDLPRHTAVGDVLHRDARRDRVARKGRRAWREGDHPAHGDA